MFLLPGLKNIFIDIKKGKKIYIELNVFCEAINNQPVNQLSVSIHCSWLPPRHSLYTVTGLFRCSMYISQHPHVDIQPHVGCKRDMISVDINTVRCQSGVDAHAPFGGPIGKVIS